MATYGTVRVEVTGMKKLLRNLARTSVKYENAFGNGLKKTGELIRLRSVAKTPVETGKLVSSSYVTKPRGMGVSKYVIVGYNNDYAGTVHESREEKMRGKKRSSGKGNYWDPSGESAFLEKAAYKSVPDMKAIFKREVAKVKAGSK